MIANLNILMHCYAPKKKASQITNALHCTYLMLLCRFTDIFLVINSSYK